MSKNVIFLLSDLFQNQVPNRIIIKHDQKLQDTQLILSPPPPSLSSFQGSAQSAVELFHHQLKLLLSLLFVWLWQGGAPALAERAPALSLAPSPLPLAPSIFFQLLRLWQEVIRLLLLYFSFWLLLHPISLLTLS